MKYKNSKKRGDAGLGAVIGWFTQEGVTVSIPLTDSQDYDLVVDLDGVLQRVQVRTVTRKGRSGNFEVNLRVCGGNRSGSGKIKKFDSAAYDLLAVLDEVGNLLMIPSSSITSTNTLTLTKKIRDSYQVSRNFP